MRRRMAAAFLAGAIALGGGLVACDEEDQRDVEEGVEDVGEEVEDIGEEVEEEIDEDVDTDGKDDK